MSFIVAGYWLAAFCIVFGIVSLYAAIRSSGVAKSVLIATTIAYVFLSSFSVMAAVGFSIEYTNQAPCENLIANTSVSGNVTTYEYQDSCSSRATPETMERLYQAYSYILYAVILISVLALMFVGLKAVVFKW